MDKVKVYKIKSLRNNYFYITSDIFVVLFSTPPLFVLIISSLDIHIKIFLGSSIVALFYFLIKQNFRGRPTYLYILDLLKYLFKNKKYIFLYNIFEVDLQESLIPESMIPKIKVQYLKFLNNKISFKGAGPKES